MKKIVAFLLVMMCVFTITSCVDNKPKPLDEIKGQEFMEESVSSDKKYIIKAYKNSGGATVDWSVLCTLTDTETKVMKNIYWKYKDNSVNIEWQDNDTVTINSVTLDLPDDTYDWRLER